MNKEMDPTVAFAVGLGVVLLLTFFTILSTGSVLAVGVLWIMLMMMGFLLYTYGVITADLFKVSATTTTPTQPVGDAKSTLPGALVGSEVFHISDNQFTYDDAPAVCAAYDAQLATLEQILDAYNHGAEWCGYGWSAGGMALYPTQKGTWDALQNEPDQKKRTACGRPGVNGGYFDPSSKFGVNCYGIKPQGDVKLPRPLPGTDQNAFDNAVARFKAILKSFNMDPYSRSIWSGSPGAPVSSAISSGKNFINQVTTEHFSMREHLDNYEVMPGQTIANSGLPLNSPYGLRGSQGDAGPAGPAGPAGSVGADSTVPGPRGPTGPAGSAGAAGAVGNPGADSTVPGPTGPTGAKGDQGIKGLDGAAAAAGKDGKNGKDGLNGKDGKDGQDTRKAAITEVLYGANGQWANQEKAKQAILNGMQDGQGIQMNQAVGDPAQGTRKTTTIKWNDNAGQPHSAWINGEGIGGDTLAALVRRFTVPGPAQDLRWTGREIV